FFNKRELAKAGEVCRSFHQLSCDEQLQRNAPYPLLDYTHLITEKSLLEVKRSIKCIVELSDKEIVGGSFDKTLHIWNIKKGDCVKKFEGSGMILCLEKLSDNEIVTGDADHTLVIWNIETGERIKTLEGHRGSVNCVAKLSDNEIVSGSTDGTLL